MLQLGFSHWAQFSCTMTGSIGWCPAMAAGGSGGRDSGGGRWPQAVYAVHQSPGPIQRGLVLGTAAPGGGGLSTGLESREWVIGQACSVGCCVRGPPQSNGGAGRRFVANQYAERLRLLKNRRQGERQGEQHNWLNTGSLRLALRIEQRKASVMAGPEHPGPGRTSGRTTRLGLPPALSASLRLRSSQQRPRGAFSHRTAFLAAHAPLPDRDPTQSATPELPIQHQQ